MTVSFIRHLRGLHYWLRPHIELLNVTAYKSAMSSSLSFSVQLRSFCSALEASTGELKQILENDEHSMDHSSSSCSADGGVKSLDPLMSRLEVLSSRFSLAEESILGPVETRLSTITLEEVSTTSIGSSACRILSHLWLYLKVCLRCERLFAANECLLDAIESEGVMKPEKTQSRKEYQQKRTLFLYLSFYNFDNTKFIMCSHFPVGGSVREGIWQGERSAACWKR